MRNHGNNSPATQHKPMFYSYSNWTNHPVKCYLRAKVTWNIFFSCHCVIKVLISPPLQLNLVQKKKRLKTPPSVSSFRWWCAWRQHRGDARMNRGHGNLLHAAPWRHIFNGSCNMVARHQGHEKGVRSVCICPLCQTQWTLPLCYL